MPVTVSWLYPKRVVFVSFIGHVTLEDVQTQVTLTQESIEAGDTPVHFVIDTTRIEKYNLSLPEIRTAFPGHDPRIGWTVVYGPNKVTRFFASILMQLMKSKFQFVDSHDEALAFIAHNDHTLANLPRELTQE
jgi:hypothetical protein